MCGSCEEHLPLCAYACAEQMSWVLSPRLAGLCCCSLVQMGWPRAALSAQEDTPPSLCFCQSPQQTPPLGHVDPAPSMTTRGLYLGHEVHSLPQVYTQKHSNCLTHTHKQTLAHLLHAKTVSFSYTDHFSPHILRRAHKNSSNHDIPLISSFLSTPRPQLQHSTATWLSFTLLHLSSSSCPRIYSSHVCISLSLSVSHWTGCGRLGCWVSCSCV